MKYGTIRSLLGLAFGVLFAIGCNDKSASGEKPSAQKTTTAATAAATASAAAEPAKPKFDAKAAAALLAELDDRSQQKETGEKLVALGTELVPVLQEWMVERIEEIAKAPKKDRWDLWTAHETALDVCVELGKECLPALEAVYAATKDEMQRITTCSKVKKLGGSC